MAFALDVTVQFLKMVYALNARQFTILTIKNLLRLGRLSVMYLFSETTTKPSKAPEEALPERNERSTIFYL